MTWRSSTFVYVADATYGLQIVPTQCEDPSGTGDSADLASPTLPRVLPNPSSRGVVIRLEARSSSAIQASIYDPAGRRIRELYDGTLDAGHHDLFWDGRDDGGRTVAAGIYLVRISTVEGSSTPRFVMLR